VKSSQATVQKGLPAIGGVMRENTAHLVTITFVLTIASVFLFINLSAIHGGHDWGGDFAQYILHARNLISGQEYSSGIWYKGHLTYPPGYPLLIAPVEYLFGTDFWIMKALNVFFWLLWASMVALIISDYLGKIYGFIAIPCLLFSQFIFLFKQSVISDLSFTFFCTAAIYAYLKFADTKAPRLTNRMTYFVLFIFLATFSLLIRAAGATLFLAAFLHLFLMMRKPFFALLSLSAWGLAEFAQIWLGVRAAGYEGCFSLRYLPDGAAYSLQQLLFLVFPPLSSAPSVIQILIVLLILLVRLTAIGALWRPVQRTHVKFFDVFFCVYLIMLSLYGMRQGPRFLLPVFGIFLLYLFMAIENICNLLNGSLARKTAIFLIASYVVATSGWQLRSTYNLRELNTDEIWKTETLDLVGWTKMNVHAQEHFAFFKPRDSWSGKIGQWHKWLGCSKLRVGKRSRDSGM